MQWLCCWGGGPACGVSTQASPRWGFRGRIKHLAKAMGAGGELADLHGGFLVVRFFILRIQVAVPLGAS